MTNDFQKQLEESNKFPYFEIEVINKNNGESEYLLCEIKVEGDELSAYRDSINEAEEKSQFVARDSIELEAFSLDEHLQQLYSNILDNILKNSTYFNLPLGRY